MRGFKYSDMTWYFAKLVAEERWLLMRGGRNRRLNSINESNCEISI